MSEDASGKYEFTEAQNKKVSLFVASLRHFAYFMFFGGACYSMMLVTQALEPVAESEALTPLVVVSVGASLIGMWLAVILLRTSDEFQRIVDTEGNDVPHLLEGLDGFGRFFGIAAVVFWIMSFTLLGVVAMSAA